MTHKDLENIANTMRKLSIEMVQKAGSGHPGLPLGCADIASVLFGEKMKYSPKDAEFEGRDRFILSAGHGSALLYSALHLFGNDVTTQDLQSFRQLHSKTPGHPEYHETKGVEATTGPLGQGIANAVGNALALSIQHDKFSTPKYPLFGQKVYCLAGDGCMMEGISHEAASFAGHLNLSNLVIIYDANAITLDGKLSDSCSENTKMRFESYGFKVVIVDGNDISEFSNALDEHTRNQTAPLLIIAHTVIGKGSPHKSGTHKVHGAPLGVDEVKETLLALGMTLEPFVIESNVVSAVAKRREELEENTNKWHAMFTAWKKEHSNLYKEYEEMKTRAITSEIIQGVTQLDISSDISGRKASQLVLDEIMEKAPFVICGSADLSSSDCTKASFSESITKDTFTPRNIKFGVREFGMAGAANGLFQNGSFIPVIGTFLTFSDYMRNAIRLAALSEYKVIYHFTHDSVLVGEDGPTHQPVEHVNSLRLIPFLTVIRPGTHLEVKAAWLMALSSKGPTALILSRQNFTPLPQYASVNATVDNALKGGYIVCSTNVGGSVDVTIIATGSELSLACSVYDQLERDGMHVKVVSMPSTEVFMKQDAVYIESVLETEKLTVTIEAGTTQGWERFAPKKGLHIGVDTFGLSAPQIDVASYFGFNPESIKAKIMESI